MNWTWLHFFDILYKIFGIHFVPDKNPFRPEFDLRPFAYVAKALGSRPTASKSRRCWKQSQQMQIFSSKRFLFVFLLFLPFLISNWKYFSNEFKIENISISNLVRNSIEFFNLLKEWRFFQFSNKFWCQKFFNLKMRGHQKSKIFAIFAFW